MRPLFYPELVNGRTGDAALFVELLFEKRAILFDLGDIRALPPRKIYRLDYVLVSHTHIDHFFGFDRLLRLLVGREKTLNLVGPAGFIDQVQHKLHAYRWNLIDQYLNDLALVVTEVDASLATRRARFRMKNGFAVEETSHGMLHNDVVFDEPSFRLTAALLEHRTPCLGFAAEEGVHVNIWKNRLVERGLPVGPWLRDLKQAIKSGEPDELPIRIRPAFGTAEVHQLPLGALRDVATVSPGQKIAYVTDVADTIANRTAIIKLARNADILFIEATFAQADAHLAAERAHLTTAAAGEIAREAGVRRVEPFHFSERYKGDENRLLNEVIAAFEGRKAD